MANGEWRMASLDVDGPAELRVREMERLGAELNGRLGDAAPIVGPGAQFTVFSDGLLGGGPAGVPQVVPAWDRRGDCVGMHGVLLGCSLFGKNRYGLTRIFQARIAWSGFW